MLELDKISKLNAFDILILNVLVSAEGYNLMTKSLLFQLDYLTKFYGFSRKSRVYLHQSLEKLILMGLVGKKRGFMNIYYIEKRHVSNVKLATMGLLGLVDKKQNINISEEAL